MSSIIPEVKRNSNLVVDIDNYRNRYLDVKYDDYGSPELSVIFPSGEIHAFEKNYFYMLANSKTYKFKTTWIQRPDYASYDIYGTQIFWMLIMFVNKVYSIEEFKDLDTIYAPSFDMVLELSSDKIDIDEYEPLEDDDRGNKAAQTKKFKLYPLNEKELEAIKAKESLKLADNMDEEPVDEDDDIVDWVDEESDWIVDGGIY